MAITTKNGHLHIGGMDAVSIASEFGTPVYVYDLQMLEDTMDDFVNSFRSDRFDARVIYASKAFNCKAMLQLAQNHGLGADVVSLGELETAYRSGMDMNHVVFHGNNKSVFELEKALEYDAGLIVLDNLMEAEVLDALAEEKGKKPAVAVRINPGIDAHTHRYIQTAAPDSKFGVFHEDDQTLEKLAEIFQRGNLDFQGFHAHIGSQIFEPESFVKEVEVLARFVKKFENGTGLCVKLLDIGGGFGIRYTSEDHPCTVKDVCSRLVNALEEQIEKQDLSIETVMIEPGRAIAAPAGLTLYTAGFSKKAGDREYLFVNGGMSDNIRPALYQAKYDADIANRMDEVKDTKVTVAGKCCESGDVLIEDIFLQKAVPGDILAVYTTGAYGYSMASTYNKLSVPGVLFVKNNKADWVIRPQSVKQLLEREEDLDAAAFS